MKSFSAPISPSDVSERFRRASARLIRDKGMRALLTLAGSLAFVSLLAFVASPTFGGIAARGAEPSKQVARSSVGTEDAAAGKRVFVAQGCFKCHGAAGEGLTQAETKTAGPRIGPSRKSIAAFISFVREPSGNVMTPYSSSTVSDADLTNVYAFLQATAASPSANAGSAPASTAVGNADNGKRLFASYGCYECHGHVAEGGAAGLRLAPDPIAFEALVKYVRHPTGQMPPYTGKVVSDSDLADIYAFLQSVPPEPKPENIPLLK